MSDRSGEQEPAERWLPVVGYEGIYAVSDYGRVWSCERTVLRSDGKFTNRRGQFLRPGLDTARYPTVSLTKDRKRRSRNVHVLVAEAFLGPRPPEQEVRHLNGDKLCARLVNLQYGSRSENQLDKAVHGTDPQRNRTHCRWGHMLAEPNLRPGMVEDFKQRACWACQLANSKVRHAKTAYGIELDIRQVADEKYAALLSGWRPQKKNTVRRGRKPRPKKAKTAMKATP